IGIFPFFSFLFSSLLFFSFSFLFFFFFFFFFSGRWACFFFCVGMMLGRRRKSPLSFFLDAPFKNAKWSHCRKTISIPEPDGTEYMDLPFDRNDASDSVHRCRG